MDFVTSHFRKMNFVPVEPFFQHMYVSSLLGRFAIAPSKPTQKCPLHEVWSYKERGRHRMTILLHVREKQTETEKHVYYNFRRFRDFRKK